MDLSKDILSAIKDLQTRMSRLESANQVQQIDSVNGSVISFPVVGNWYLTNISQDGSQAITGWSWTSSLQLVTLPAVIYLNAGTHTLKLQYKVNGSGTATLPFFLLGYII